MMKTMQIHQCPICGQAGSKDAIERLPHHAILMKIQHEDGTEHKWAQRNSLEGIGLHRIKKNPVRMHCPKCGRIGRISGYHPNPREPAIEYLIVHEKVKGTWGKDKSTKKRRRCYITEQEQRNTILKKLGRYIR